MSDHNLLHDPIILILALGSITTWAIIFGRIIALRTVVRADDANASGSTMAALRHTLADNRDASREHLNALLDSVISRERRRIEGQLSLLGAIGSISPYVGLLGTVVGIIQAFQAIQQQNNMSPAVVSGGIATALVATAAGLSVAIPAVAAHHLLMAAIGRRVEVWEETITAELPDSGKGGAQ
ncbi:MAG TPA: MotA/TolQ/ExbB proton channel family protein [Capsulimonadaceae bacterium]|jgi:biopolymer transport protein ExbB/TolQ